ncbi:helicase-related protein [Paenibacillus sp. sgz5001063]|uniref:helicase-related protein n=1 Tax=Paenibacillus sp. sgz5001063 TaxID=3242474 RepID=UPI0036D40F19
MQVAVYAVELGGDWSLWVSLDMNVDRLWWSSNGAEQDGWSNCAADKRVLLSMALPLGWAVKLREQWSSFPSVGHWQEQDWGRYMADVLRAEIDEERRAGGSWSVGRLYNEVSFRALLEEEVRTTGGDPRAYINYKEYNIANVMEEDRAKAALGDAAEQLIQALNGRSLLQTEVEALLAEQLPGLTGQWRAAAQLCNLQGRLSLDAAVGVLPALRSAGSSSTARGAGRFPAVTSRFFCAAALRLPQLRLPRRGVAVRRARECCLRCGSAPTGRTACAACGLAGCAYCEACLALGRSRACALLLRSAALPAVLGTAGFDPTVAARRWGLSAAQAGAAGAALEFLAEPRKRFAGRGPERFLLWAVTGAGKTEITFPLLEAVLAAGGCALVATPRRDVVLELAPRLAKAFPAETLAVLYGGSADRWIRGRLTLATTHQLLRFNQSFDLVIIDELDAYPYHNNAMLAFAAESACRPGGRFIFLSATPPVVMQREIRGGRLPHAKVPARYHGHPLPVPHRIEIRQVEVYLRRQSLPASFVRSLEESDQRGAQIFVFVSRIRYIEPLVALLRLRFPALPIQGTSSQDKDRADKVLAFRSGNVRLLVTTTILERGVTVPKSDVYILDADCSLFDETSLVQMAGRAGRSVEDPSGKVLFASPYWTRSQRSAIRQIQQMNKLAYKKGYLHSIQEVKL